MNVIEWINFYWTEAMSLNDGRGTAAWKSTNALARRDERQGVKKEGEVFLDFPFFFNFVELG